MKGIYIIITLIISIITQNITAQYSMDLSGTWSFQLDNEKAGERERWFEKELAESIRLPGSTDEQGFGVRAMEPQRTRLTREYRYVGPAWYQKIIEIPESWQGKHVELFLERAMWETKVWLDDHYIGTAESLVVPHRFDLSDYITPGSHRLTIRIDNRLKFNVGHNMSLKGKGWARMWAMSVTEESQTNWNGAIGQLAIRVSDPVRIERLEAYPDLAKKETRVVAYVRSHAGAVSGEVTVSASCGDHRMGPVNVDFKTKANDELSQKDPLSPVLGDLSAEFYESRAVCKVELILPFGEGAKLWDEFSPDIYKLEASMTAVDEKEGSFSHERSETFGLREFVADGDRFLLNGRSVFLRGNQDNCIHPGTAYPPMDKQSWLDFLQKHKDYGLNCMRFHSWCPPEAAFDAADELGMFVHVEGPVWDGHGNIGYPADRAAFVRFEMDRIQKEYGNHPSFCMMAIGNEFNNHRELYLQYILEVLKYQDDRHLYTAACHPADTNRNDEFYVGAGGLNGWARGLTYMEGSTDWDYEHTIEGYTRPFISHEIGQYTSFPDFYSWFNEEKYSGPLKAEYIGLLKEKFEQNHPPERGPEFATASGAVQLLLYKTEIEAMLRTPSMAGFHLNGLMDYPGEGVALIGMLDAMGDSKGIATPEEFRQFCSVTVPLVRLPSQTYDAGDEFVVPVEVRHHGATDLYESEWSWRITDQEGKEIEEGRLCTYDVPTGKLTSLGSVRTKLPQFEQPAELTLQVWMENSQVKNQWPFWVYPTIEKTETPSDVMVSGQWTPEVKKRLKSGGKVLLTPAKEDIQSPVDIRFGTVFWGRGLFPTQLRPLGIWCDPAQPALARFPTREYAGWQWQDLLTETFALTLNNLPFEYEPVVYIIDDFNESHRLGVLMEAQVGKGRLLISTMNLGKEGERSMAQEQMLNSLLNYTGGEEFNPSQSLSLKQVEGMFRSGNN
ncbi:MAG: hypothetical protein GY790_08740 [Bacteroidetes bacterium]|nr:hypothetical protein [Bacteroidota bacterium]